MTSRRVAAIDCGTNSVRLLIAEVDPGSGLLADVAREMRIVRLGEGVDATGLLNASALERAFGAVDEYARLIEGAGVDAVRFVATSATRDAKNRADFVSGIRGRLGVEPEVISGDEEAALSFTGATNNLEIAGAATPCLVVDIGGGSTEFVMGEPGRPPSLSASVDIGCVRMTERHFLDDPPWPAEVSAARDDIDAAIAEVAKTMPLRRAGSMVGLAGSVTTVAALAMGMWEYDSARIHGAVITAADTHRVCEELLYSNHEKRSANPVVHPGRVDVIAAGSLVLSAIVAYTGLAEILVSEHDILDGIAAALAAE
ncbi:MAG: Ppx/GppA family phosphatase [Actinomycetia bacterium]|nr:Ppx/GppA family phosphatase [Actinomycetes bacterium]